MTSLREKIVWLTGASSGIGEALAYELARRRASLIITARNQSKLAEITSKIQLEGGKCLALSGDVQNLEDLRRINNQIEKQFGGLDILIANAGSHVFTVPERFDSSEYINLMDLNYGGILRCIQVILPKMLDRKSGHIVGVASLAGYRALPRAAAYGASKAAVIHFLESLRFHMLNYDINVTVVNPGFVRTPLTDKNDFNMPFLVDADFAAKKICQGIETNKQEIAFPFIFSLFMRLVKFVPSFIYQPLVRYQWKRMESRKSR